MEIPLVTAAVVDVAPDDVVSAPIVVEVGDLDG